MVRLCISKRGFRYWCNNEKWHRANGPAISYADGDQEWYLYGERHRTDGPAVMCGDGFTTWFWHGRYVSEYEHMMLMGQEKTNG